MTTSGIEASYIYAAARGSLLSTDIGEAQMEGFCNKAASDELHQRPAICLYRLCRTCGHIAHLVGYEMDDPSETTIEILHPSISLSRTWPR